VENNAVETRGARKHKTGVADSVDSGSAVERQLRAFLDKYSKPSISNEKPPEGLSEPRTESEEDLSEEDSLPENGVRPPSKSAGSFILIIPK
jgi:hypothetical protein